jgi:hypothetical protein
MLPLSNYLFSHWTIPLKHMLKTGHFKHVQKLKTYFFANIYQTSPAAAHLRG